VKKVFKALLYFFSSLDTLYWPLHLDWR